MLGIKNGQEVPLGALDPRSTLSRKVIEMRVPTAFLTDCSGKKGSLGAFPSKVILELLF